MTLPTRFPVLRFLTAVKAARDFGLDPSLAGAIALDFDPTRSGAGRRHHEELVETLAVFLDVSGAVRIPDHA